MEDYSALRLVVRARTKLKRELLRAPGIKAWSGKRYYARLEQNAANLPLLSADKVDIFAELGDHGIAVRSASAMVPPFVLQVADRLAAQLSDSAESVSENPMSMRMPEISLPVDMHNTPADCRALYEWGLTEENLDLAERYLGLPASFLGASVRRERADGPANYPTRQWHKDIEDRRMLKVIIYLSDVGSGGGAFEYLKLSDSEHVSRMFRYSAGTLSDAAVAGVVERSDWSSVTGPRLTAIFVDPTRLLHRAQPPTKADRYSLTLSYVSTTPLYDTVPGSRLTPTAMAGLSSELTERQLRAATVRTLRW